MVLQTAVSYWYVILTLSSWKLVLMFCLLFLQKEKKNPPVSFIIYLGINRFSEMFIKKLISEYCIFIEDVTGFL